MKRFTLVVSALLPVAMPMEIKAQTPPSPPAKVQKIAVGGDGGWDYLTAKKVVEFDGRSLRVLNRWPLADGKRPTGLALDRAHRRLFSVCGQNQTTVVLDADNGKILATLPIGPGSDGCVFDPDGSLAFSSNGGDGTLTAVREEAPDRFSVVATIPTQRGARTTALDPKTHRIYLSAATYTPRPEFNGETKTAPPAKGEAKAASTGKRGGRRANIVPGSFVVLVVGD